MKKVLRKERFNSKIDNSEISSFSDAQLALSKRLGESGYIIFLDILRNENFYEFSCQLNNWLSTKEPSNLLYELGIFPPLEPVIGSVLRL